jgi:hypothetical protein
MGILNCCRPSLLHTLVSSGDVLNVVNRAMKLTCGKLLKQGDWNDWQESKYLQLNQYHYQGMFGLPQTVNADAAIFPLIWMYNVKALDGRKKGTMRMRWLSTHQTGHNS